MPVQEIIEQVSVHRIATKKFFHVFADNGERISLFIMASYGYSYKTGLLERVSRVSA